MDIGSILMLLLIAVVALFVIALYNNLVTLKHNVAKAWSNIDVLLKQRHDELPKLVEVCKRYMSHEQNTLEKVIKARSSVSAAREAGNLAQLGSAETLLRQGLGNLFALAENYPELKADENFRHLQQRITSLENAIADRREFYNETVNVNNVRIEQFPDVIVARIFSFGERELLEFSDEEKSDVDIKSLFA